MQDAHHERTGENIYVSPHRHIRYAEIAGELGVVHDLGVVVAKHGPEPPQGGGGDVDAQLGNIALEKSANVVLAPHIAGDLGRSGVRTGKTAAPPQPFPVGWLDIVETQSSQVVIGDAAR